jgi:hypothetical protein
LNFANTGDRDEDRARRLQDINRDELLTAASAESMARQFQHHRYEERRELWKQKREEELDAKRELSNTQGQIRLAYGLTNSWQAFADALGERLCSESRFGSRRRAVE